MTISFDKGLAQGKNLFYNHIKYKLTELKPVELKPSYVYEDPLGSDSASNSEKKTILNHCLDLFKLLGNAIGYAAGLVSGLLLSIFSFVLYAITGFILGADPLR